MATRERWLFDGWELTEGVLRDWAYRAGTGNTAPFVGEDTSVPGRSGQLWRPKVQGPATFSLDFWFQGADRQAVQDAYNTILRAMRRRHRLVTVTRTRASGEQVVADVQLVGTIEPTYLSQRVWRATATFVIPAGCWRSVSTFTHKSSQVSATFPKNLVLTGLEPSTEAMDELTVKVHGPGVNIKVADWTDGVEGDWFKYAATMTASQFFTLNCKTWAITAGTDADANDDTWVNVHAMQYSGTRYLPIPAARPGDTPTVKISMASGGTTATYVEVAGPRAYAV